MYATTKKKKQKKKRNKQTTRAWEMGVRSSMDSDLSHEWMHGGIIEENVPFYTPIRPRIWKYLEKKHKKI